MNSIIEKIQNIRKNKNAVILAHNYQIGEVQDIADFCGDSLELSIKAANAKADIIVFCGVKFMAETAAILSPQKKVLLPDLNAGCPMADMLDADGLQKLKEQYPDAAVICYVNSTAEVKALSDCCCTSSNALQVVQSVPKGKQIIFVPDKNLGQVVKEKSGRDIVLWPGYCPTHILASAEDVKIVQKKYPNAITLAHPECPLQVRQCADILLSTGGMLKYVKQSQQEQFIIATEIGIIHALKKQNPEKSFYPASEKFYCPNMKKITLEKVLFALEDEKYQITVPSHIADKARTALQRMLEISSQ